LFRVILLGTGPATLAWTQRSAKSSLKFGERVVIHRSSPYGWTLRERGNALSIRWQIQQFRGTLDAFQPGGEQQPSHRLGAADVPPCYRHSVTGGNRPNRLARRTNRRSSKVAIPSHCCRTASGMVPWTLLVTVVSFIGIVRV